MSEDSFNKEELNQIARYQAGICWLVVLRFIVMGIAAALSAWQSPYFLTFSEIDPILGIGFMILAVIFAYRLARALKRKYPWAYALGILPLFVNIIVILYLVIRSTQVLKAHNISVGLMGAKQKAIHD